MVEIIENVGDPAVPLALLIGDNQYAGKEPYPLFEKVFIVTAFTAQAGIAVCDPQGGIPGLRVRSDQACSPSERNAYSSIPSSAVLLIFFACLIASFLLR